MTTDQTSNVLEIGQTTLYDINFAKSFEHFFWAIFRKKIKECSARTDFPQFSKEYTMQCCHTTCVGFSVSSKLYFIFKVWEKLPVSNWISSLQLNFFSKLIWL